jgi:hypothetical protein
LARVIFLTVFVGGRSVPKTARGKDVRHIHRQISRRL